MSKTKTESVSPTTRKKSAKPAPKKVSKPAPEEVGAAVRGPHFTTRGEECGPDDERCAAKTTDDGRLLALFNGGDLYEPFTSMRKEDCRFRPVNEKAFTAFVEYLKSGQQQYLMAATRHVSSDPISFIG
jgi:hypothetical protein